MQIHYHCVSTTLLIDKNETLYKDMDLNKNLYNSIPPLNHTYFITIFLLDYIHCIINQNIHTSWNKNYTHSISTKMDRKLPMLNEVYHKYQGVKKVNAGGLCYMPTCIII